MTSCRATAAALSVPVFDAGNISPHLAPLFQARGALGQRARARHSHGRSATVAKARNASSEVHHKALVECV
jgi:hypothetical protein